MRVLDGAMAAASIAALGFLTWIALGQPTKPTPDVGKPYAGRAEAMPPEPDRVGPPFSGGPK